jgi:hypothetical protein
MARGFATCLRGQTSLNHLCHAARTVLKDPQACGPVIMAPVACFTLLKLVR